MAIKYSEKIFEKVTQVPTEDKIISVINAEFLQLVVTGTSTSFKIRVYAQMNNDDDEFFPVAAISDADFMISSPITKVGLYKVDISCFLRVKIVLEEIQDGEINCNGQVVSMQ